MENSAEWLVPGAWIGRQQAFALIATKCSAAQAQCLKEAKESRVYEKLHLTWEDFCTQHAGISRVHADRLIQQFNEFGDAYFRLSTLARISPETYRLIAPSANAETISIGGETLALTPENAPKIRAAVQRLRAELRSEKRRQPSLTELHARLRALADDTSRCVSTTMPNVLEPHILEFCKEAAGKFTAIARTLDQIMRRERNLPATE
jgi:hypothetical protein